MKKKLLALLFALVASIGTTNAVKIGSLYYYLDGATKTANVIKPEDGSIYDLVNVSIPSSVTYAYEGQESVTYTVEGIARYAFEDCTSLTSLTLPNTIKAMGDEAFCRCTGLTSVIIPNSVTYMGWNVFSDCTNLTSIELSTNLSEIGLSCFANCKSLTSITIPSSLEYINMVAFTGCSSLVSVTIPEGVKKIGESAFNGCSSLKEIIIPNSVTEIGPSAFRDCESLASVTIGKGVTTFGGNYYEGLNVFENCTNITSVVWNAINANGDGLFSSSAEQLTSFVFGDEVQTISNGLCRAMIGLTSINIPNSVTSIGDYAFYGCSNMTSVTIGNSVTSIGESAFELCHGLTSINIPNSVTNIGKSAFENCTGLTSINIANGVTSIGESVFSGCTGLTSMTLPNSVTSIGASAFYKCSGLNSATIPNSVTSVGDNAFMNCSGLTSVTIGNSVTSIGSSVFYGCSGLTGELVIPNSVVSIENSAFYGCKGLTSVTIPSSVTSIGNYAFYGCSGLTSVTIPNSVTSIGYDAFRGCSSLNSVTIPNSVTSIGSSAFYGCSGLTSVSIPNSVTSIGDYAFYGCSGLTSVTIGNSVTSIGEEAFRGCSGLTSVTIPNSVTSIGNYAFRGCAKISYIKCEAVNPPLLGSNVFYSIKKSTPLYVPAASVDAYKTTDKWKDFTNIILILTESDLVNAGFDTEHNIVLCINLAGDAEVCNDIYYVGSANNWGKGNGNVEAYANCTKFGTLQNFGNWFIAEVPFSNGAQGMPIQAREDGRWSMFNQCGDKDAWYHIEEKSASISNDENNDATIVYPSAGAYIYQLNYWKEHHNPCIGGDCGINLTWALDQEDSVLTISGTGDMNSVSSKNSVPWYNYSTAIKTIYLPDSITGINNYAFSDCSNVTSMFCGAIVPPTVKSTNTFKYINKAIPVYVPYASMGAYKIASNWKTFTNIKPIGECETLHGECGDEGENVQWNLSCDGELSLTGAGSMVSSGWKLDSIPWKAYFDYIKTIHISDSITYISNYAFKDGYNVTSITCKATTPPSVTSTYVFTNINKSIPVYVPEESVAAYKSASIWKTFTNILPIDDGMFTVEFIDWNGTILKKDKVAPYSVATAPADPEREGYTFTGWDKEFSSVTANLTVTAQYKINRYAVTFVDWDEAILKKDSVDYGSAATAPADPTREGYTFTGWDKDFSNVTTDLTVTALYEKDPEPIEPEDIITRDILDLSVDGVSIDDWTINDATLNEKESDVSKKKYAFDVKAGIPSIDYVTSKPRFQFQYGNSADKAKAFFIYPGRCYESGGKNGLILISNTQKGDTIKLEVAAKGSTAGSFEDPNDAYPVNATALTEDMTLPAKGAPGADNNGYTWRTLEYLSQGGDVILKEVNGGYRIRLIELIHVESSIQTDITSAEGYQDTSVRKILRDGQIFILRGDKVYTITGQTVK